MKLWKRFRLWCSQSKRAEELDDEMRAHQAMLKDELVRSGMTPDNADAAVHRQFGSHLSNLEQSTDEWRFPRLDAALGDVKFALRLLARKPLFTLVAVMTVALGVGANTAIVSVLKTVLLNPLGLRDTDKVVVATVRLDHLNMKRAQTSGVEYRELRSMDDTFSVVAAVEGRAWTAEADGQGTRLVGRAVTSDFFHVFGEKPLAGRFFQAHDQAVAVISAAFWNSQFGRDISVIGRTIVLDGVSHQIVGITPPTFRYPADAQLWTPLILSHDRLQRRGYNMNLSLLARLKDGVTISQAANRVNSYIESMKSADGAGKMVKNRYFVDLEPFADYVAGNMKQPLLVLWVAAVIVLVAGCANVAALLLSRTAARKREIAIRLSIGASRVQIVRQLLTESTILGFLGGIAGIALAAASTKLLADLTLPGQAMLSLVSIDYRLMAYGMALSLLSGLIFGFTPAIQVLRESQTTAMARSRRHQFQNIFVAAQVAAAIVLLITTGLLLRSLWAVGQINPGFDSNNLTTAYLIKPKNDPGFIDRLQSNLQTSNAFQAASLAYPVPFSGGGLTSNFLINGRQRQPNEPEWHGEAYFVSSKYFETLRIPLLRGRSLADSDNTNSPVVCVIDSRLADRFFPNQDPVGQEIGMYRGWARVVGVVASIRATILEEDPRPMVYYSLPQVPLFPQAAVIARSNAPTGTVIRGIVNNTNRLTPVFDIRSMNDRIAETTGIRRVMATLVSLFGAICLLLATSGLYGVIAQVVSERTKEIGIRMALGARPTQVLNLFLNQGLRACVAGLLLGLTLTFFSQKWIASFLFGVRTFDSSTIALACLSVCSMVIFAVWLSARKATFVDPQAVLRHE